MQHQRRSYILSRLRVELGKMTLWIPNLCSWSRYSVKWEFFLAWTPDSLVFLSNFWEPQKHRVSAYFQGGTVCQFQGGVRIPCFFWWQVLKFWRDASPGGHFSGWSVTWRLGQMSGNVPRRVETPFRRPNFYVLFGKLDLYMYIHYIYTYTFLVCIE